MTILLFLTGLGIIFAPRFTIGMVLLHFGYPVLATIAFIMSFLVFFGQLQNN